MWFAMLLAALAPAMAEDPVFAGTETGETIEKPEATASVELGGVYNTGNAEFYTVNAAARGAWKWQQNRLSALAGANLGAAIPDTDGDGRVNAKERKAGYTQNVKRYFAEGRYDRFISERSSLYVLGGAFVDPFAGYDLRSHEQIGISRQLVKTEDTLLVGEIGFDWAQENYVAGVDPNYQDIFAGRVLIGFSHTFNEGVSFTDTFELYENVADLADLRLLNTATLSSALSSKLSLKLSHSLIFDNVPVEGFEKLDQTTMITLVATLL